MVDPRILQNSLNTSGSSRVVTFEKYITTDIQPTKLIVSNSSTTFGIQFFHTGSANKRTIIASGSIPITSANPVTLYPNSGSYATSSSIELLFDVNINELNTAPEERTEEGNQLVEDIYFNLVPLELKTTTNRIGLPGLPPNTRLFEVNTISGEWANATERNLDGLGFGGIQLSPASPSKIRFTSNTLLQKREKLQRFKSLLKDRRLGSYFNNYFKAASDRAKRLAGFKIILYAILWENEFPRVNLDDLAVIPFNNEVVPRVFFNWGLPKDNGTIENWIQHGRLVEFDSDSKTNEGGSISYINNYLLLINDILAAKEGIATEIVGTEAITDYAPTPEDAINVKIGTLDVDVAKTTFSLSTAIESASRVLIDSKTLQFFNEEREYKTVLNFGLDDQYLVEAWRPVTSDSSSIQLKLVNPLSEVLGIESEAHIVREFAKPVIDTINIDLPPFVDNTPYLRPPNMDVGKFSANKQSISNVTLSSLGLETGSMGQVSASLISYEDRTFNRWYTSDFNSSQLNIDFKDYSNFITFGSAQLRLEAFKQKLLKIEQLNVSASISSSSESEKINSIEVEYIKRNFDPYEQFLYFDTAITPYSASAYYANDGIEYNATGSWPKNGAGKPITFSQVNDWYLTQSDIAKRYDEFNPNYLVKHLPQHIQEDVESDEFLRFIAMFGHVMDNLKVYIDQFPYIYSTNPDPLDDLSMDQTYEVAKSFGINLPNAYSLESLQSFVESTYGQETARSLVAETWKRFLHSYPLFAKTKGSKSSLELLLNAYGINTPSVQIKESSYPTNDDYLTSDEYAYAIQFISSSANRISIPFVSSSISASSFQIRFKPTLRKATTLLSGDDEWAIDIAPHPSSSVSFNKIVYSSGSQINIFQENKALEYGRLQIVSGSARTVIATSSYFPLFSDDYTHIMLRSQSQDITIVQTDGDQILFQESASINWGTLWNNTQLVHIGGSGSIRIDTYDGIVDEVHGWTVEIDNENFIKQTYDPGSYYGATYTSSYDALYVHLGFSQPLASITQSATNESPYVSASSLSNMTATGFLTSSYQQIIRSIKQYVPTVGALAYSDTKVHVAPPPVFDQKFIYDDGSYILSRTKSIKSIEDKKYTGGLDTVWFAVSPTEFVNQTIMRSMGVIDVNYLIGSPRKLKKERYTELDALLNFYLEHYNQDVDPNQYIRFYKNLLKAPTEYARTNIPARANLLDGIVVESPILERSRISTQKAFRVDGANTVLFEKFVAGSGSANVGAYQFDVVYDTFLENDYSTITKPVLQYANDRTNDPNSLVTSSVVNTNSAYATITSTIDITSVVRPISSTPSASIAPHRAFLQNVSTNNNPSSSVVSSLTDNGSGVGYVVSTIDGSPRAQVTQSGYSRNPYLGLTGRINTELNTKSPYYAIEPVTNFNDVGTTTYFYNTSGIYWFNSKLVTKNIKVFGSPEAKYPARVKRLYKAKLDILPGEVESPISDLFANITLLDPQSSLDYPGRDSSTILSRTYTSGSSQQGVLKAANILSLYNIEGTAGLRVRLYRSSAEQSADLLRPFSESPTAEVLFDAVLSGGNNLVFPYTLIQTDASTLYFTVTNTTSSTITSRVVLYYFKYQPSELIPIGYLPRHYKFNRYEGVAQRRRNHLGCKIVYCPEGCTDDVLNQRTFLGRTKSVVTDNIETDSPVIIYPSSRTSAVVNRSRGTGGGTSTPPPTVGDQSPIDRMLGVGGKGKLDDKKK